VIDNEPVYEKMTDDEQRDYALAVHRKLVDLIQSIMNAGVDIIGGVPMLSYFTALAEVAADALPESEPERTELAAAFVTFFHSSTKGTDDDDEQQTG